MIAGLLPLFNMSKRKILTFITTKSKVIKDICKNNNCIIKSIAFANIFIADKVLHVLVIIRHLFVELN